MAKKDKNSLLNIHYSRTLTPENLSKAANYVGGYVLKGLGAFGKFLNAGFTSPTYGTTGQVSYARNAEDTKRLRELSEASEQAMGKAMTWVSPLNYGAAIWNGHGLNAKKGEEEVASWSPAWQAVGRLGELYVGPKAVKGVKATPRVVVNTAAKAGVKPAKAAVVAREINKGIKQNTNKGRIEVTGNYFNSPDKWYRITETPEKYGIMELGKNVTTHDAPQTYGTINGWRSSMLKAPITKSSEGFIKRPQKIEIGIRRKNGQAHGNTSQAAKGKLWGGTTSGSNLFPEGIIEGQAPSMINYGIDRTNFVMTPWELVPNGGRVGFHTGEMPMSNLGWFQRTNKGTYTYEPIISEKRISYQPKLLLEPSTSLAFFERKPSREYVQSPKDITSDVGDLIAEGSERSVYASKSNPNIVYKIEDGNAPLEDINNIKIRSEINDDIIAPETTIGYYKHKNGKYYRVTQQDKYKSYNPDNYYEEVSPELNLEIIKTLEKAGWKVNIKNGLAATASKNGVTIGNLEHFNWGRDSKGNLKLVDLYVAERNPSTIQISPEELYKVLKDQELNGYYFMGHGTGRTNVNPLIIFDNGLRIKNGDIGNTTSPISLSNLSLWPHANSKEIIILPGRAGNVKFDSARGRIPSDWYDDKTFQWNDNPGFEGSGLFAVLKPNATFVETEINGVPGVYTKPEAILGSYNIDTQTLKLNPRSLYEFLFNVPKLTGPSKNNIVGASYDYRIEDPKGSMDFLKQFFALLKINGKEYTLEGLKDAKNVQQGLPEYIQSYLNLNTVERAVRAMRKNGYSEREIQLYINKVNEEMNKVKVGMYSDLEYNAAGALDFGGFYNNDLNFISVNKDAYLKDPKFTPDYVMKHEGRHLIDYRTGMVDELNKILEEAYDKDFLDIPNHEDAGSLKGYEHINRERVTTNRDARDVLLSSKGKNLLNEHEFMLYASKNGLSNNMVDFLNKIIKYALPEDIVNAVENSNGYGKRYINYLKKNNKLTPAKIEQLRLAMIHVPSYLLPVAGGYTLYNLFNLPLQQLQYLKQGGKMNKIRKMLTASGGPINYKRWDDAKITSYTIPFIKEKAIKLTNAGRATGAVLSTNLLDSLADNAIRAGVPIRTAIGISTKESTLGNPTDDRSAWNISSKIRKLFNGVYPGTVQHINNGTNLVNGINLINYHKGNIDHEMFNGAQGKSIIQEGLEFYKTHPNKYNPGLKEYQKAVDNRGKEVMNSPEVLKWYREWERSKAQIFRPEPYKINTNIQNTAQEFVSRNKQGGKINMLEFLKNGSGIHIKKKNRGKFTSYCGGKVTDECIRKAKASGNPTLVKRATFADNARHFKHRFGGIIKAVDGTKVNFWLKAGNFLNSDTGKSLLNVGTSLVSGALSLNKLNKGKDEYFEALDENIKTAGDEAYNTNVDPQVQQYMTYLLSLGDNGGSIVKNYILNKLKNLARMSAINKAQLEAELNKNNFMQMYNETSSEIYGNMANSALDLISTLSKSKNGAPSNDNT